MEAGAHGAKIPAGFLLANPFEKPLKPGRTPQRLERRIKLLQLDIGKHRVKLLVARLAKRYPLLGPAAAGLGMKMMQGDQLRRHLAPAQRASSGGRYIALHG